MTPPQYCLLVAIHRMPKNRAELRGLLVSNCRANTAEHIAQGVVGQSLHSSEYTLYIVHCAHGVVEHYDYVWMGRGSFWSSTCTEYIPYIQDAHGIVGHYVWGDGIVGQQLH